MATEDEIFARLKPALPQSSDGKLKLVVGDSYKQTEGRPLEFSPRNDCGINHDGWPDLSGATVAITLTECPSTATTPASITKAGTVVTATGAQLVRFELEASETNVPAGRYRYQVKATLGNGNVITLETDTVCFQKAA